MESDPNLQLYCEGDTKLESVSESDESGTTESEESDDDESIVDEIEPTQDYMEEVTSILTEHINVSFDNALELNKAMQTKLFQIRGLLEDILYKCEQKYAHNNAILKDPKEHINKVPYYRACGMPYFKDLNGFPAPRNNDYKDRIAKGEIFLTDLQTNSLRYWTSADKSKLIRAIKSQVLDYLYPETKSEGNEEYRATTRDIELNTIRLTTLLKKAKDYEIDWELVSNSCFKGRHSSKACCAMWHGYMKPELNRNNWTNEENQRLMLVAEKHNFQNWPAISSEMENRSENQCFVQFQNTVNKHFQNNRKWTPQEDEQLIKAVEKHTSNRTINWNQISGYFINRSKKSIYSRYHNSLIKNIKKGAFSREEDCILLAAIEEYGENFACIPMSLFPNRSRKQVKNRYLNTIRYQQLKRGWTLEDDESLYKFVQEYGKGKWSEISKILKVHSRGSCRTRYGVIEKFFEKNPNATLKDVPRKNRKIFTDICKDNWVEKMYELRVLGDVVAEETEKRREKNRKRLMNRPETYRDLLRSINRSLYDLLKYSYNYNFMKIVDIPSFIMLTLPFYFGTLKLKISPEVLKANKKKLTQFEMECLMNFLKNVNNSITPTFIEVDQMPINWNTILGMRALTILANNDSYRNIIKSNTLQPSKHIEAEKMFKERFRKIFSKAALLTRILPDVLINSKFIVQYNLKERGNIHSNLPVASSENSYKRPMPSSTSGMCEKRQKI